MVTGSGFTRGSGRQETKRRTPFQRNDLPRPIGKASRLRGVADVQLSVLDPFTEEVDPSVRHRNGRIRGVRGPALRQWAPAAPDPGLARKISVRRPVVDPLGEHIKRAWVRCGCDRNVSESAARQLCPIGPGSVDQSGLGKDVAGGETLDEDVQLALEEGQGRGRVRLAATRDEVPSAPRTPAG